MPSLRRRISSIVDSLPLPAGYREKYKESSNGLAVFVSIVAAVLIWFMISMRESYSVARDFPVEYVNVPPDTAFAVNPARFVRIRVEGAGWQLLKLYTTSMSIQIDASRGSVDLFAAASRSLAPDLTPRNVTPGQVTLPLEPRTTKKIPIVLNADVETVPPFDLMRPLRIDPDSVVISGAISVLARINSWPSDMLEMDRVNVSFSRNVILSDSLSSIVDRSLKLVTVFGDVAEFTENRRLLDVRVTGAPDGERQFRLIPDQVSVRYRVPIAQFEASAVTDSFYAAVSYSDILADTTGRVAPSIKLPANIVVKDLDIETSRLQYYIVLE